jgi:hypothetical protein
VNPFSGGRSTKNPLSTVKRGYSLCKVRRKFCLTAIIPHTGPGVLVAVGEGEKDGRGVTD